MRFLNPSCRQWLEKVKQQLYKTTAALAAALDRQTASQPFNEDTVSYQDTRL